MAIKMSLFEPVVAIVALFILLRCKVHAGLIEKDIYEAAENEESIEEELRSQRSLYPEDAFLAGESTPVWLAHEEYQGMVYTRLDKEIVKKAIDYFKSENFYKNSKHRRNADEDISLTTTTEDISVLSMESREEKKEEFLYPSLLVTMEYENSWPTNEDAQNKVIFNKILYALAYWNEVDIQLRPIRYPSVRIRIAGIVIAKHKDAMHSRFKSNRPRLWNTLLDGLRYWFNYRKTNEEFRQGTFNVLAMMTDQRPLILTSWGYSMSGPNCNNENVKDLSGLIVHDDQRFSGISYSVWGMAHMMGRSSTGSTASAQTLESPDRAEIRRGLQSATCWKKPNEIHPPGKPVETILPEDIYQHYNL